MWEINHWPQWNVNKINNQFWTVVMAKLMRPKWPSHCLCRMDTINLSIVLFYVTFSQRHTLLCRQRIHLHTEYSSIKQLTLTRLSYTMTWLESNGGSHVWKTIHANGTHALRLTRIAPSQKQVCLTEVTAHAIFISSRQETRVLLMVQLMLTNHVTDPKVCESKMRGRTRAPMSVEFGCLV
jgi:hypothetical protein